MLPFPNRVWLCQRQYERFDGIETVESICTHESLLQMYRDEGYTITEYLSAETVRGIVHAASTRGEVAGNRLDSHPTT